MKIKDNYVLQMIADEYLVVPIAEEADRLHGVIKLNQTGAFLWNCLTKEIKSENELENAMMNEYNISQEKARVDVHSFVDQLATFGCLED